MDPGYNTCGGGGDTISESDTADITFREAQASIVTSRVATPRLASPRVLKRRVNLRVA